MFCHFLVRTLKQVDENVCKGHWGVEQRFPACWYDRVVNMKSKEGRRSKMELTLILERDVGEGETNTSPYNVAVLGRV